LLLPRLALPNEQIRDVARRTAKLLKDFPQNADLNGNVREHRDVDLLLSLPGLGQTIASTILTKRDQLNGTCKFSKHESPRIYFPKRRLPGKLQFNRQITP
jgi:hypothetical protein